MYYKLQNTEVGNVQGDFKYICSQDDYIVVESDEELQAPFVLIKERFEPADNPEALSYEVNFFINTEKAELQPLISKYPYEDGYIYMDVLDQLNIRSAIEFSLPLLITVVKNDNPVKVEVSGKDLKRLYEAYARRTNKILNTFAVFQNKLRECKLLSQIRPIVDEYREAIANIDKQEEKRRWL